MPLTGNFVQLLIRGLLAGLIAGVLAGAVAYGLGEPHVDAAIAIEESKSAAEPAGHSHGDEEEPLVSRDGQKAGLFLATSLAGLALGAIFATAVHYARRFSSLSGPVLALTVAGGGWLAFEVIPFLKYPANPPAVGDPETINERTWLWFASVLLGLAAVGAAVYVARLVRTQTLSVRVAAPLATVLVVAGIGYVALPGVNEVPADFPATLLWQFRVSSLAVQATLWTLLGVAFAFLTERVGSRESVPANG